MSKGKVYKHIKIGPPILTKYERARIIGARALQLSMGAMPLIDVSEIPELNPLKIAEYELNLGILPITIRRVLPTGEYQNIPLKWLIEAVKELYTHPLEVALQRKDFYVVRE